MHRIAFLRSRQPTPVQNPSPTKVQPIATLEVSVSMANEAFSVRYGMASTRESTKVAFNLSNEDCSVSVHTHSECDLVRSIRGAAMSA